ncbi:hypothetical protein EON66_01210 [archaeon]|nr:MAG: hypothetical protein EON66_01210 [archaeon]
MQLLPFFRARQFLQRRIAQRPEALLRASTDSITLVLRERGYTAGRRPPRASAYFTNLWTLPAQARSIHIAVYCTLCGCLS